MNTDGIKRINDMALAVKDLSKENAMLILSTAGVSNMDKKAILVKSGLITAEEADAVATTTDTMAKGANLTITEFLTIAWAKLIATLKAHPFIAVTAGVTAMIIAMGKLADRTYNAEKYAKEALDKSAEKVDTVKSEIESLNSELQITQSRIDELNAKENLSLVEQEELNHLKEANKELEREMRLKQSILSEEQKDANKDAKKYFTTKKDSLKFESSYEGVEIHETTDYVGTVEERIEKLQQYTDGKIQLSEETVKAYKDYVESAIAEFMDVDDYLIEGQDDGLLNRLNALYEKFDIYTNGKASVTENKLRGILSKTDFRETSSQLEELGKSGELSLDALSSRFPELIKYLHDAGISAQELYQYIMALSNPDAINYDNVRKQFMESLGIRDGKIRSQKENNTWENVQKELAYAGNEEIILEAYLKIKDQYGSHPEGWTTEDWISNIQSELDSELLEINSQLSITDTISALNSTLPSALNSLSSAYQSIFTQDGFTLENVGLDMLDSIRTSIDRLNSMEGLRLNIDSSTFENFARVLTDTSSTASDVEAQFKSLNGTIIRAVGSAAVNPENFDVLSRSLEDLGCTNTQEVLTEIMQAQTDFQAVSDRLGMSLEDAANATYQETVQLLINSKAALADKQALWQLAVAQGTITDGTIATESNVAALLAEAQAAGLDAATLTALENVKNGNIKDTNAAQAIMEQARQDIIASMSDFQLDFDLSGIGPAPSSLSHAGRSAGASYVDAFEKELDNLKESRDQGKITEKEYLDYLRKLYQHFFRDKKKYAKEYDKYEQEYLQGMKSLYESALSGVTSILDKQINAYEDSKSAAVDSLEAERDARIEVLEAQKDQYEEQIKLIEKQIALEQMLN